MRCANVAGGVEMVLRCGKGLKQIVPMSLQNMYVFYIEMPKYLKTFVPTWFTAMGTRTGTIDC